MSKQRQIKGFWDIILSGFDCISPMPPTQILISDLLDTSKYLSDLNNVISQKKYNEVTQTLRSIRHEITLLGGD